MNDCHHCHTQQMKNSQRGPSSYGMHNADTVFAALNLNQNDIFLDIGCGQGEYSLMAAQRVGPNGIVYAIDQWPAITEGLVNEARERGIQNITGMSCDINKGLRVKDNHVDVCLLATILHATRLTILATGLASELHRILKPHGRVAVLECKKEEQDFGPSIENRLAPQQVDDVFTELSFERVDYVDLGYNYMVQYRSILNQVVAEKGER